MEAEHPCETKQRIRRADNDVDCTGAGVMTSCVRPSPRGWPCTHVTGAAGAHDETPAATTHCHQGGWAEKGGLYCRLQD